MVTLALPAAGQRFAGTAHTVPAAYPIVLPNEGLFQARFAGIGDDLCIAGQPTEAALRELSAKGVTTVRSRTSRDDAGLGAREGTAPLHGGMAGQPSLDCVSHAVPQGPRDDTLTQARAINLRDDQPHGGQQPIEGFLVRPVRELARLTG